MKPIVACVLKSGGIYSAEWVYALRRGLRKYAPPHEFVCLTDMGGLHPWRIPLADGWPGWWSKIELFRPGLFKRNARIVYVDLDTLVTGDLSDLFDYDGAFAAVEDFYRKRGRLQSCVMAWTPGKHTDAIYSAFAADPNGAMTRYRGDQEFIEAQLNDFDLLTAETPGQIVSYKVHAKAAPPDNARLVCFHGKPKPTNPATGWAHKHWHALHVEPAG